LLQLKVFVFSKQEVCHTKKSYTEPESSIGPGNGASFLAGRRKFLAVNFGSEKTL